jgi:hypothetical protein
MFQAILLSLKCLSFDFVGTSLDESTEDPGNIQVPSSWRPLIEDPATMQLFLDVYATTKPPLSSMALECLVRGLSISVINTLMPVHQNSFAHLRVLLVLTDRGVLLYHWRDSRLSRAAQNQTVSVSMAW